MLHQYSIIYVITWNERSLFITQKVLYFWNYINVFFFAIHFNLFQLIILFFFFCKWKYFVSYWPFGIFKKLFWVVNNLQKKKNISLKFIIVYIFQHSTCIFFHKVNVKKKFQFFIEAHLGKFLNLGSKWISEEFKIGE